MSMGKSKIGYWAKLLLGFYCYVVVMCQYSRCPLPDPDEWPNGWLLSWAGFWSWRMPYKEWREAVEATP